jgi:hypothetical protein
VPPAAWANVISATPRHEGAGYARTDIRINRKEVTAHLRRVRASHWSTGA